MKRSVLRKLIKECIRESLHNNISKVCAWCDKEAGVVRPATPLVSHGICNKHLAQILDSYEAMDKNEIKNIISTEEKAGNLVPSNEKKLKENTTDQPQRVCYQCIHDLGLKKSHDIHSPLEKTASGGQCRRHFVKGIIDNYRKLGKKINPHDAEKYADEMEKEAKAEGRQEPFCPDLTQQFSK